MNKKLFWSILIILAAYSIPIVTGLVATHVPEVAWAYVAMLIQLVIVWINWNDEDKGEDAILMVSWLVFAIGILVAVVVAISAVAEMLFLTIVMFIASLFFFGLSN